MSDQEKTRDQLLTELTDLRQQLDALKTNEAQFRQAVLSISDHIYVSQITVDGQHANRYISPHAEQLTGYPLSKFAADWSFWPSCVIHPDDRSLAAAQFARLSAGRSSEVEYRVLRADQQVIWVRDSGKVVIDPQTQIKHIYGVVSDITERKQLEARLTAIYQLGHELNLLRDEEQIFERLLTTTASILPVDELYYEMFDDGDRLPAPANERAQSRLSVPMQVGRQVIGFLHAERFSGDAFIARDRQLLQTLADQAAIAIENARLFGEVNEARRRLRSLSHRLVEVQETERRWVARELHDEAGQALASLMVGLRLLENDLAQPQVVPQRMAELKRTAEGVLDNLHRLAMDLHPASLDHLGLIPALRQYTETFGAQHDLEIQFETVGLDSERLPPAIEINLYRIVQEALANIARHAQATQAGVIVERRGGHIVAIAEDNGIGFDFAADLPGSGRLGLVGMRERAEMLGGQFEIESTAGIGTTVYVEIPYANPDSHR
ncbi:MAG TPA: PAS domain-containing protein [Anaerolineae bacterium]|nr:PAS domain-containing protein [Anaerolineae bacterium]